MQFKSRRKKLFLSLFHSYDMRNIISFPLELMNSNETTEHDDDDDDDELYSCVDVFS